MNATTRMTSALTAPYRERLMQGAREVSFAQGERLFSEGQHADRFWVIRTGTVALDLHVPGRRPAIIETLGHGELLGWSWLYAPYTWQMGAEAVSPVRAYELDAETVRTLCRQDPVLGTAVALWVGRVLSRRLLAARTRLLDLYAPYGSGLPR
ncbi:Crp/Fnr family transcriptional regulator [Streptomyces sp. NBC_01465]|uniref:Crp/Fnr family transcriptional regulator n=1 Tax=Streptomyces sp. NBC_01465 TaxID=2903878 RepID=UPI002E3422E0|nr:cyclic nucleotide-binding domain-containing protein [Streptomyces sp. NBC_01465]